MIVIHSTHRMNGMACEVCCGVSQRTLEAPCNLKRIPEAKGDLKVGRSGVKPPLALLPLWCLEGVSRVFEYGNRKYAPGNWCLAAKDGEQALQDYMSATLRHLSTAAREGFGSKDSESGLPHVDHAICSLIMLRGLMVLQGGKEDPGRGNDVPKH